MGDEKAQSVGGRAMWLVLLILWPSLIVYGFATGQLVCR